jgi:2-oxoisovalerate dehydrogenase E1 component
VKKLAAWLQAQGVLSEKDIEAIHSEVERELNDAASRALAAARPAPDTAALWVFSPTVDPGSDAFATPIEPEGRPDTMVAAINRTLKDEMSANPRIVVFGEDVADCSRPASLEEVQGKGGVFKLTHGLQRSFGAQRVFNSPLAEANIIGRAVGMSVRGLKPVVEIQFFDYIWPAMQQLRDEMSMMRYRSGNTWSCPGTCGAARRTTARPARPSSRTHQAFGSSTRRMLRTRPACFARRSGATIP